MMNATFGFGTGSAGRLSLADCTVCPRECHADRTAGARGYCGCGDEILAARASLHAWEEPCISGERGSGTVFFAGCSLGCVYCQNRAISDLSGVEDVLCISEENRGGPSRRPRVVSGSAHAHDPVLRRLTTAQLAQVCLSLEEQGACNINLVTPTHFTPLIAEAIAIARDKGLSIPIVWNTSGYEKAETLRCLDGLVDIYLTDAKYAGSKTGWLYSRASDYFERFAEALEEMVRQTGTPVFEDAQGHVLTAEQYNARMEEADADSDYAGPLMKRGTIVRHLLLPGLMEESKRIIEYLLPKYRDTVYLSLMNQYTPLKEEDRVIPEKPDPGVEEAYSALYRHVSEEEYEEILDYAIARGLENGFFQGQDTDCESFIPDFDGRGLELQ